MQARSHSLRQVPQEILTKVKQEQAVDMQLTEQQVVALRTTTKSLADIFAEDTAVPTTQDEVMALLSNKSAELGFKEPMDWIRSLVPNKGDISLAVAGVGAGVGGVITGYIRQMIPQLANVSAPLLNGVVGWLLYKWGQRKGGAGQYISAFGGGMVIGAIATFVSAYAGGMMAAPSSGGGQGVSPNAVGAPADVIAAAGG